MRRVIYSLYIDIPKEDLDYQDPYPGDDIPKTERTRLEFQKYYGKLLACKQKYANDIGVEFQMFEYDDYFKSYKQWWNDNYPFITEYNIVNFYKIQIMNMLCEQYDEVLYLDFDVVPMTKDNFFEEHDLSQGIAIKDNNNLARKEIKQLHKGRVIESVRSPTAKYWNCLAMLESNGYDTDNDVFNTGIVGVSSAHMKQMGYFKKINELITMMDELKSDEMYPEHIREMFGYDNETIWSYLIKTKELPVQWLHWQWHLFYDRYKVVPKRSKFVHVINKKFKEVFDYYETNHI